MSTVLLAIDGSDLSTDAMARAVEILGPDHRFVTLAVVPPAFVPTASISPMESHPMVIDPALEQELDAEHQAESAEDVEELDEALHLHSEHLVETGEPGPVICQVADDIDADIIVVGSHGHGLLKRVLMGSVSTYVLHHATRPVLVIRADEPAAPAADA